MHTRLLFLALLLASLAFSSGGCLAVAVGAGAAGTVAYMRGDLEAEEPHGIEQTYTASREAVDELGLKIIEGDSGADAMSARVTARDSSDKKVVVRLKAITSNATKVKVRVGTFGDEAKTRRIYNAIHDHLAAAAAASSPASTPVEPSQTATTSSEPAESATQPSEPQQAAGTASEPTARPAPDAPASPSP